MKKILVTGGTGYIGCHISLLLLERGFEVIVLDSLINSNLSNLKTVIKESKNKTLKFKKGDLRKKSFLKKVFLEEKNSGNPIDGVIHLAGMKYISDSFDKPILYWDTNVSGSITLLEVAA